MEDPSEIARLIEAGDLLYVHALDLKRTYNVTHVRWITVGTNRWCMLTLAGLCSELLVANDAFTENEDFCINVELMPAELVYRGPDAEGHETLSVLYYRGNRQG